MGAGRAIQGGANDRAAALTALRGLIGSLTRSARSIESHTGITNAQLFLLRQFTTAEPLSVNELAERVHARQNTVSSVVGRLAAAGLVEKMRSSTDGRSAALSLTPKGRRLLRRAPASPVEVLIAGLDGLSSRAARQLAAGLQALVTNLNLDVDAAPMLFESSNTRKSRRR